MKGKYESTAKKSSKKGIALLLVLFLLVGCVVGATFAWLSDSTATITNTNTAGMVDIDLTETTGDQYKLVPGQDLDKDPKVTIKAGSEACWVFVKIEEGNDVTDFITYATAAGWTELDTVEGVYYRQQEALTAQDAQDVTYSILNGDKVSVKSTVTATDLAAVNTNKPTLKFTAYAIQQDDAIADAAAAWTQLTTPQA